MRGGDVDRVRRSQRGSTSDFDRRVDCIASTGHQQHVLAKVVSESAENRVVCLESQQLALESSRRNGFEFETGEVRGQKRIVGRQLFVEFDDDVRPALSAVTFQDRRCVEIENCHRSQQPMLPRPVQHRRQRPFAHSIVDDLARLSGWTHVW